MEKESRRREGADDKEGNEAEIKENKERMKRREGIFHLIHRIDWIEGRHGTAQEEFGRILLIFNRLSTLQQKLP